MANFLPFRCFWDKAICYANMDEISVLGPGAAPLTCESCGKVNFPNAVKQSDEKGHEGQNYLECIAYTAEFSTKPVGAISIAGSETLYISAKGEKMTRAEFIAKYHSDPAAYIIDRTRIYQLFHKGRRRRPR